MKSEKFYQCELVIHQPNGITAYTTTWLPARFATIDKILELKDNRDEWTGPWKVHRVYRTSLDAAYVRDHERTDDVFPSLK